MEKKLQKMSYILQFIDSAGFMASSLSNLVDNLSEGIHGIKCEYGHNDKKCETCEIKYKHSDCFLEYTILKIIQYNANVCVVTKIINTSWKFEEKVKEQFFKTYKFSNHSKNLISLSLFYCCEKVFILMNIWMIGKNATKHHYLKKKIFLQSLKYGRYY